MTTLKDKAILGHSPYILFKYEDVKQSVLNLINYKRANMFTEEQLKNINWAKSRKEHNRYLQAQIDEIMEEFGDFEK